MRFRKLFLGGLTLIVGMVGAPTTYAETFTFENLAPTYAFPAIERPGAITSLSITGTTVGVGIGRVGGTRFDLVSNTAGQAGKPVSYGNISLDPFFNTTGGTDWIINFSTVVTNVSLDFGDYGDDADVVTLAAFDGTNLTGIQLGNNFASLPSNTSFDFTGNSIAFSGTGIRSIRLSSTSSTGFPNSLFLDNLNVTAATIVPEASTLALFGLMLPTIGAIVRRGGK